MKQYSLLVVIAILVSCIIEIGMALLQLFGLLDSNHNMFALTGTFPNPGPLGGYISICISVMFAYYFWGTSKIVRLLCLFVSLSGIIILPSTQSRSAVLALVVSVFMMIRKIEVGRYYLQKHGKILLFLGIIAIMFMYIIKKSSADGRVFMDSISVRIICKNIRGVGPDNFAGAYGEEQFTYFKQNINNAGDCLDWTNLNENIRLIADCPDRAYNEYIQIGVEYGLVAMLYFISMIIYCIYISYERNDYLCYGLIAFAVFSLFSYPLHLILFQILFSVFIVSCLIPVVIKGEGTGIILFIISTAICHNCVFSSVKKLEREKKVIKEYNKIEQWYENEYYEYVVEDCKKIFEEMQNNRFFLFTYGRSLQFVGSYEKSDSILMMGAKVSSDPMFWNVMGNNVSSTNLF